VAPPNTNFCAICGVELKPISYELWVNKFVNPALETRLAEVVLDASDLFPPLSQLGLARSEAGNILDSLLAERTGVERPVLDGWIEKTVSLLKDVSQREVPIQNAIQEAKKLNIALVHATAIVDILNRRIERPATSSVSPHEDSSEAKSETHDSESLKRSAKSCYRRLVAGGSVTNDLTYVDLKKSASRDGTRNGDFLKKVLSPQGTFVLFVSSESHAWVFPNPKLIFNADSLKPLFGNLTADLFNNFKDHIEPVPVIRIGKDCWQVQAADKQWQGGQSHNAAASSPEPPKRKVEFPISAADYLARTEGSSKVVRHDFGRNLLVTNGEGELSLIRNNSRSKTGDSFFVVPRITRFTRDTFQLFYKKYYDCAKPSVGEVWIIQPAVVSKVPGGWQLMKKGVLEIDFVPSKSMPLDPEPKVEKIEEEVTQEIPIARPPVEWRIRLVIGIGAILILLTAALFGLRNRPGPQVENRNASPMPSLPINMVRVPGGEFLMGNNAGDEYEKPAHKVIIKPFLIDIYEVTCEEYLEFVKATGHRIPSHWPKGEYPKGAAKKPVTGVDWDDATAYASWAKKRLPTEEEWEFAARGSDGRRYPWGNDWLRPSPANAAGASRGLADVGSYKSGASLVQAYDMVGNAWEWTASPLVPYPGGHLPPQQKDQLMVIRGGSWESDTTSATTTYRWGWPARGGKEYSNTGFRCAKDIAPDSARSLAPRN